jgi:hypothetical protein
VTEILVPISVGELLDKLTILQIKSERIHDAKKLVNIRRELAALASTCVTQKVDVQHILVMDLRQVNEDLWVVEDKLREKEHAKIFDEEFIKLARDVYFTNDRRAAIKKEINTLMGSTYVEEKSYAPYT